MASFLAERKWAEANAGNLSVHLHRDDVPVDDPSAEIVHVKNAYPTLNGEFFLVTATKSRARDVAENPENEIGLIEIIDDGNAYKCHWGKSPATSEFPAHMSVYSMCMERRAEMRAILHTHPPYIIAISHLKNMQSPDALNKALMRMHPEVGILLPDGITGMQYKIPGSIDLGKATRDALSECNLTIWPMHGVVSLAPNLDIALDQVEIVEKAARIYILILLTGQEPVGLTDMQILESRKFWGIE